MPAGVYLHIPFCKSRCSYCDFATDVFRNAESVELYVRAICREIKSFNPRSRIQDTKSIDTIYFGGGTPSLLTPAQVQLILTEVRDTFEVALDSEVTMEMNPATVTSQTLAAYRRLGINRASFGVQTFDDRALKMLARGHDASDARQTFRLLRDEGFDNISFDLIAGLPGQALDDWRRNLEEAMAMRPEHLSLYLLEIHEGTPLAEQVRSGRQPVPEDELAAKMYEEMIDALAAYGYVQYEISNFAKPGYESRHNTKYWKLESVFGFGVSAHSFDGRQRYSNERDTARYVGMIEEFGIAEAARETVNVQSESTFLGLRLAQGIDMSEYRRRFLVDLTEKYGAQLQELIAYGLIERVNGHIRLTRRGMLFSNEVFSVFV
ncbi:MAG TPA: radical SAM family heme chaperone HemW [Pyrinomonadaceae bacterium]